MKKHKKRYLFIAIISFISAVFVNFVDRPSNLLTSFMFFLIFLSALELAKLDKK